VLAKLRQALHSRSVNTPQARQWSQLRSRLLTITKFPSQGPAAIR